MRCRAGMTLGPRIGKLVPRTREASIGGNFVPGAHLAGKAPAFYRWRTRPCSERDPADAHLTNAIIDVHADDPEFGYRFIADELEAAGLRCGERRMWRLCRQQRIWSYTTKKGRRGSVKVPGPAVHDDLVGRQFHAERPDAIWLTYITEHPTVEGNPGDVRPPLQRHGDGPGRRHRPAAGRRVSRS